MILNYLSALWTSFAPTFGNHLWQSTIFTVVVGLLTFVLRRNHAGTRYWLWLSASLKFLFPFSLLVGLGTHLAWSQGSTATNTELYLAMTSVGQPFTQPKMPMHSPQFSVSTNLVHLLPVALAALWLCGFVVVLCLWNVRWRRISGVAQEAMAMREGREVETLRRVERTIGIQKPIEMRLSRASLEPGIFGIIRPVLVWPKGITEQLDNSHLEAILAHELLHVRRRDNLAAAVHMLVEAIFWFYPLVWWVGGWLLEERERACDEAVLDSGGDRKVYAESILKICEFCVGSPMTCVSGVTGADLKKRIHCIMTKGITRDLDFGRKLLLGTVGVAVVALPIVFGLLHATQSRAQSQVQNPSVIAPVFEVVSVKPSKSVDGTVTMKHHPDGITATNVTVRMLVQAAYGVQDYQVSGTSGPMGWVNSERYDVEAKVDGSLADQLSKLSTDQRMAEDRLMLQALLADRFKLLLRRGNAEGSSVYALVIAENGSKLQQKKSADPYPEGVKGPDGRAIPEGAHMIWAGRSQITGIRVSVADLTRSLSQQLSRTVLDKTGLAGNYDFTLKWGTNGNGDSILTAIQEQLGLKLESQEGPVEVLVIDHVEPPSGN
jgi:bla regulator protein blaR1